MNAGKPMTTADLSLHPIDVGVDLRTQHMPVSVPADARTADVCGADGEHVLLAARSHKGLCRLLHAHGYTTQEEDQTTELQEVTVTVKADPDEDDCLIAAAKDFIRKHPKLTGYDLDPRWEESDDDRENIVLTVPSWFVS